jgi:hypothetical protein
MIEHGPHATALVERRRRGGSLWRRPHCGPQVVDASESENERINGRRRYILLRWRMVVARCASNLNTPPSSFRSLSLVELEQTLTPHDSIHFQMNHNFLVDSIISLKSLDRDLTWSADWLIKLQLVGTLSQTRGLGSIIRLLKRTK